MTVHNQKYISMSLEYQKGDDSFGCQGLEGGSGDIVEISQDNFCGPVGSFDVQLSSRSNGNWYLHIWSKLGKRCSRNGFCYSEVEDFYITELDGKLYGEYILPVYDICDNREKRCGKLIIRFN